MRRFFRRPLFALHDPFFSAFEGPTTIRVRTPNYRHLPVEKNAHQTFDEFFEAHGIKEN